MVMDFEQRLSIIAVKKVLIGVYRDICYTYKKSREGGGIDCDRG